MIFAFNQDGEWEDSHAMVEEKSMKNTKGRIWKWLIAFTILVAWIGIDGLVAITTAQVQPPRRKRRIMISTKDKGEKAVTKVDIGKSLMEIARRASRRRKTEMVDFVFVIERSQEMEKPIAEIEKRLPDMMGVLEESKISYRFAQLLFQNTDRPKIKANLFTSDLHAIQAGFHTWVGPADIPITGYGLEAIMWAVTELDFRSNAKKYIILVTNSGLRTSWEVADAKSQLVRKIIDRCNRDAVHINAIGMDEPAQMQLADETKGKWYPIDQNQKRINQRISRDKPTVHVDKSVLTIEGVFKLIARHIASTVRRGADIVFVFDSSLSMDGKVDKICAGIDRMVEILDDGGLDYRFGVIRFWAAAGGGESTVVVTKPPLDDDQVKSLFRLPKRGDEHLLDAMIRGVPKLKTPDDRQLVLFIVTDEATSRRREKGYTPEGAISVCRQVRAQVNVIGGITPIFSSFSDVFQQRVAEVTRGKHFIMPGSTIADERW